MANTGKKLVTRLKEVYVRNGLATGNYKANLVEDPDYIAPYNDPASCPVNYTTDCPANIYTGLNSAGDTVEYEFTLNGTTVNNPNIKTVSVQLRDSNEIAIATNNFTLPQANYFHGFLTATTTGTHNIRVLFLDVNGNQVAPVCNGVSVNLSVSR